MGKPAPKGNKYGTKIKDAELRQEAYKQYCDHLAAGYSKDSWHFKNPIDVTKSLCCDTMDRYIDENPTEFAAILIKNAKSQGMKWFEDEGRKIMQGKYRNASPEIWKTCMRNKYKWDKEDTAQVAQCAADKILDAINARTKAK